METETLEIIQPTMKKLTTEFIDEFSKEIYEQTYRYGNETINDTFLRVAKDLASVEKDKEYWTDEFLWALSNFKFVPGGRITSNAGTGLKNTTYVNCFVSGFEGENQDSMLSILDELRRQALILCSEGGYGFCLDVIRPRGGFIEGIGNETPGAVKMLDMWDTQSAVITAGSGRKTTKEKGKIKIRKGAQMVTLSCWHSDIEEFITAKQTPGKLTKFNMSVLITDEFIHCVKNNLPWRLEFPDFEHNKETYNKEWDGNLNKWKSKGYKTVVYKEYQNANELWNLIMKSTYNRNEPGVLFVDTINKMNNLHYCEYVNATNPCVVGGTLVLTTIGWIKIENLYKNYNWDEIKIITRDKNNILSNSTLKEVLLTEKQAEIYKVCFSNGEFLLTNAKHKFYDISYQEISVESLMEMKKEVKVIGGKNTSVIKVEKLNYREDVFDLTATPNFNFFSLLNKEECVFKEKIVVNDILFLDYFSIVNTSKGQKFAFYLNESDEIL